jgi:hypothetical protein
MAKRKSNPSSSTMLLIGGAVLALYLFTKSSTTDGGGGGDGGGGDDSRGQFIARAVLPGIVYGNGVAIGPVSSVPTTYSANAGVPFVLYVLFDDGRKSAERTVTLTPGAAAGSSNSDLLFAPIGYNPAVAAREKVIANLVVQGKQAAATAVEMAGVADTLVRARRYEEAIVAYQTIVDTYPGTVQATAARFIVTVMTNQLKTVAGRAALDRANPIR